MHDNSSVDTPRAEQFQGIRSETANLINLGEIDLSMSGWDSARPPAALLWEVLLPCNQTV